MRFMACFVLFSAQNYAHASCMTILIGELARFLGEWAMNDRATDSQACQQPAFAKLPHIDTNREALQSHPPCAKGRFRPMAHRNQRLSTQKGSSRAAVWRNATQISPLAPLGRNDKGPGSAEMTRV
jgi:hypothetical protein